MSATPDGSVAGSKTAQLEIGPTGRRPDGPIGAAYDWERFSEILDLVADVLRVLDEAMAQL